MLHVPSYACLCLFAIRGPYFINLPPAEQSVIIWCVCPCALCVDPDVCDDVKRSRLARVRVNLVDQLVAALCSLSVRSEMAFNQTKQV